MTAITSKKIEAEIRSFTTNKDKLSDQAQSIAMLIFYHAAPKAVGADCMGTGDCTQAIKLVKAMPKSWAAQMLEWFREMTPIRVVVASGKCEFDPKYKRLSDEDKLTWWKLEEANTTTFAELTKEQEVRVYDFGQLVKMVESLAKRIEKKLDENEVKPEDIESAKVVALTLNGLRFDRVKADKPANDSNGNEQQSNVA